MAYGPFNNQLLRTTILLINEELIMLNSKGIAMKGNVYRKMMQS